MNHANEISYGLAFMTGILGTGHCLGMCGGLVSGFFMRQGAKSIVPYLAYHAARVSVYVLIGLVAASLGAVLAQTGLFGKVQGILQIIAGLVVILLGFDILGVLPISNTLHFAPMKWIFKQFATATQRGPVAGSFIGGAVNGLMPCSMVMAMAVQATTAPGPLQGGLLLLAFGLGTLPAMFAAGYLFGKLGIKARGWLIRSAALFVIALGLSTLWQGLTYYSVMRNLANW